MPLAPGMVVEIDVRVQLLTVQVFMRAAADVLGVIQEAGDTRDAADEREKLWAADHLVEPGIGRPQALQIGDDGFASRLAPFVQRIRRVEGGEFRHQLPAEFGVKKLVDNQMPERMAGAKLAVQFVSPAADGLV